MTARYFHLEDLDRVVKVEDGLAYVRRGGAWWRGPGFDSASGREITAEEAERLIAASDRGDRFTWSEEDFESGGVYFHHGDEEPEK